VESVCFVNHAVPLIYFPHTQLVSMWHVCFKSRVDVTMNCARQELKPNTIRHAHSTYVHECSICVNV